jgi:HPt (histidine-containing phosphotransfer) domain-containing protein
MMSEIPTIPTQTAPDHTSYVPTSPAQIASVMRASLFEAIGDDAHELAAELATAMLDGVPRGLAAIATAITLGDSWLVGREAHALKGSSSSMGLDGLAGLCDRIEAAATAGRLDAARLHLDELSAEFIVTAGVLAELVR